MASFETLKLGKSDAMLSMTDSAKEQIADHKISDSLHFLHMNCQNC
jgi:hypothetical protein